MTSEKKASPNRSFARACFIAFPFGLMVMTAILFRNFDGGEMGTMRLKASRPILEFGWPLVIAERTWNFTVPLDHQGRFLFLEAGTINGHPETSTTFHQGAITANLFIGLWVVLGSTLTVHRFCVQRKLPPPSLRAGLALTAVVGCLLARDSDRPLETLNDITTAVLVLGLWLAWLSVFDILGMITWLWSSHGRRETNYLAPDITKR